MNAKYIVILMMITLIVLFFVSNKYRKKELEREKREAEDFENLLKESNQTLS